MRNQVIAVLCGNCGFKNPPDAVECHKCGAASKRLAFRRGEAWLVFRNRYGEEVGRG